MLNDEFKELTAKSQEYVYNVMFDDNYTPEKYKEAVKQVQSKESKPYTDFDETQLNITFNTLIEGYSAFGRDFLTSAFSQDLDSSINMFEVAVQQCLDLNQAINEIIAVTEKQLTEKQKEETNND